MGCTTSAFLLPLAGVLSATNCYSKVPICRINQWVADNKQCYDVNRRVLTAHLHPAEGGGRFLVQHFPRPGWNWSLGDWLWKYRTETAVLHSCDHPLCDIGHIRAEDVSRQIYIKCTVVFHAKRYNLNCHLNYCSNFSPNVNFKNEKINCNVLLLSIILLVVLKWRWND